VPLGTAVELCNMQQSQLCIPAQRLVVLSQFFYLASKFSKTENNRDDDQTWLCHLVFIINGILVL